MAQNLPTLQQAIKVIKAGDKKTGRKMLADILQADLDNEMAWLWMFAVATSDVERRKYLKRVLKINPNNEAAKRGLAKLPPEPESSSYQPDRSSLESKSLLGSKIAAAKQKRAAQPESASVEAEESSEPKMPPGMKQPLPPPEPEPPDPAESDSEAQPSQADSPPDPEPSLDTDDETLADDELLEADTALEPDESYGPMTKTAMPLIQRLVKFWNTGPGTLILGGGGVALVLICCTCIVLGLVFQPLILQLPPTVVAIFGTETPTATATPLPPTETPIPTSTPLPTATFTSTPSPSPTPVVGDTPTVTPPPSKTTPPDPNFEEGNVTNILSGNVIEVLIGGQPRQVKYLLVDVPEVNDPHQETHLFGVAVLDFNQALVGGKTVTLEKDITDVDEQGRLLRYVYVDDLLVNEEIIRQGLGWVALVPPDLKYAARLQRAEEGVKAENFGVWGLPPTPEASSQPPMAIVAINEAEQYVEIVNSGEIRRSLAGWKLTAETTVEGEAQECILSTSIGPGEPLRIWALASDVGKPGYNCGFSQNIWGGATAVLYNNEGQEVSRLE